MFKFYAKEMLASSCNRSRRGVCDKPLAGNPGVIYVHGGRFKRVKMS